MPLTRMALIGEEQCGDMQSVPVENSTLNLKQQAPKARPQQYCHLAQLDVCTGAAVEERSQRNDKEGLRGKERDTRLSECSELWSERMRGRS